MKTSAKDRPAWQVTNIANLYIHRGGGYYYRAKVAGKTKWTTLRTKLKSVAVERMADFTRADRQNRRVTKNTASGALNIGEAVAQALIISDARSDIAENSKKHRHSGAKALLKSWPELAKMDPRKLTAKDALAWSSRVMGQSVPHIPRGATTPMRNSKGCSKTTHNSMLDVLRMALDVCVEAGAVFSNVARDARVKRPNKKPTAKPLPSPEEFRRMIAAMREIRGNAVLAADLCELMAFTGARRNEIEHLLWADVDFGRNQICLRITKNGNARFVPMIDELRSLLETLKARDKSRTNTDTVARVYEAQKSLNNACASVGIARMTHHDFRHLAATTWLESGIDVPTAARILGHQDGGALLMKTYGHLRDDHAQAMMARVSFTPKPVQDGKVISITKGAA
jgi:integrase